MTQVLIVDDEVYAIRGLQVGIDWEKLGVRHVLTAHSMKQAQEILSAATVDLMICDIEMPQGSGIELVSWVRQHYPLLETVFLTCHSDFSYAKQAIQLDSFDYLLKPVDYVELEEVIGKALAKIKKDEQLRSFEGTVKYYEQLWELQQPLLKEHFWQALVQNAAPSAAGKIDEELRKYKLEELKDFRFVPELIRIERWYKKLTPHDQRIMEYALRKAAEEQLGRFDRHAAVISLKGGHLLALLPEKTAIPAEERRGDCAQYIQACNKYFFCDICCYLGLPVDIQDVAEMVGKLLKLDADNVTALNETIELMHFRSEEAQMGLPSMNEWAELLNAGNANRLFQALSAHFESVKAAKASVDAAYLQIFYQSFLQMLFYVLQRKALRVDEVFSANLLTGMPESALRSLQAFDEWIRYLLEVAVVRLHQRDDSLSIVDRVKQFVKEHIAESGLSREDIAGHVYLNPDYLTRIFKKETGLSISDFLQQQRIQYAKELFETSDRAVSEVAVAAGYSNLSHFSTIFKKLVQMSPNEYRKQFGKK